LGRVESPSAPDLARDFAEIIPDVLRRAGLEDEFWEQQLIEDWTALVGQQIARNARPGKVERGTLFVYVNHSVWLNELSRYGKKEILQSVQERFGSARVRTLRLQLDPDLNPNTGRKS